MNEMKIASHKQVGFLFARRRRKAFTLAEAMLVVALLSILLSFVLSFLVSLQRYDAKLRNHGLRSEQLSRLAETIRSDIRQAITVSSPAKQTLRMESSDGRLVQYELTPEGCRRTVNGPDNVAASADLYRIGPADSWTIETGPAGRRPLHVVSLASKRKVASEPVNTPLLVQAALGADAITSQ